MIMEPLILTSWKIHRVFIFHDIAFNSGFAKVASLGCVTQLAPPPEWMSSQATRIFWTKNLGGFFFIEISWLRKKQMGI